MSKVRDTFLNSSGQKNQYWPSFEIDRYFGQHDAKPSYPLVDPIQMDAQLLQPTCLMTPVIAQTDKRVDHIRESGSFGLWHIVVNQVDCLIKGSCTAKEIDRACIVTQSRRQSMVTHRIQIYLPFFNQNKPALLTQAHRTVTKVTQFGFRAALT